MIVMKFGGSSLASVASIRRVVSIVQSEVHRHPVVVASAMGETTDRLLEVLLAARRANSYCAGKLQEAIRDQHFTVCEEFLSGQQQSVIDQYLRNKFRDLHVRMLELCEGERPFTPELQDWTVSLGEQLSSQLLAAVLQEHCGNTIHLDSRKLILTDSTFTNAQPRYWETYSRIRSAVQAAGDKLVVLGGFMGSTEDGRTTTLGRGGSDLTASLVGAALNAGEIQVWKDVDGMLTCDPRLLQGGHQVKRLSYEEATELANSGAVILHPETMTPAKRLKIPIVIRNTFCPAGEGTRIGGSTATCEGSIKSIAIRSNITLLEVFFPDRADDLDALISFCREHSSVATVLCSSERALYIAVDENSRIPEQSLASDRCLEVRIRRQHAVLTLVGQGLDKQAVVRVLSAALQGLSAFVLPSKESSCSVRVAVPQELVTKCLDVVHRAFFSNPDPVVFVAGTTNEPKQSSIYGVASSRRPDAFQPFVLNSSLLQPN